jgi:hypothetical protein
VRVICLSIEGGENGDFNYPGRHGRLVDAPSAERIVRANKSPHSRVIDLTRNEDLSNYSVDKYLGKRETVPKQ